MSTENEKNRTDDKNIKGDDVMTPPILNREKLWNVAKNNTKKNEIGQATISSKDYTFDDNVWDEIYRKELERETDL